MVPIDLSRYHSMYKSSISPFFVLFPVLWVVAAVLSESLDEVGGDWSGSGPIVIIMIGNRAKFSLSCLSLADLSVYVVMLPYF